MAHPVTIFLGALTGIFQPSAAVLTTDEKIILDFELVTHGLLPVRVQWYPEFTWRNPTDPSTNWLQGTAEEDLGNGNIRMPSTVRRFSTNGADVGLPPGTHQFDVQLHRTHCFYRIQLCCSGVFFGSGCLATVRALSGIVPIAS